jgi:hypothetical protein
MYSFLVGINGWGVETVNQVHWGHGSDIGMAAASD